MLEKMELVVGKSSPTTPTTALKQPSTREEDVIDRPPSLIKPSPCPGNESRHSKDIGDQQQQNQNKPITIADDKEVKEQANMILPSIFTDSTDYAPDKFTMCNIYEEFEEEVDSPPSYAPSNRSTHPLRPRSTSAYSGQRRFYNTQLKSLKTDSEGITTTHTTYLPPPLTKKKFNIMDFFKGSSQASSNDQILGLYSDNFYDMSSYPRGVLTLINMKDFSKKSNYEDQMQRRDGTDKDAVELISLFLDLGFVVERYDNPSSDEILAIMKVNAALDYTNKSCCACAILSHGDNDVISSKDGKVNVKDIIEPFKARELAGIPKVFIFQACRGGVYMKSYDDVDGRPNKKTQSSANYSLSLPREADFIYAYSTVPGYYSWRNAVRGTWFIEALVQVFRTHAHKTDVLRMLVKVNEMVTNRCPYTNDEEINKTKQIPSFVCQLRKDLFLFPPRVPVY